VQYRIAVNQTLLNAQLVNYGMGLNVYALMDITQIWNGYTCVCINGYFMVNNNCVTCPRNTLWNGVQCVGTVIDTNCQVGQIFMNGQ
jgi:hypothetical protein